VGPQTRLQTGRKLVRPVFHGLSRKTNELLFRRDLIGAGATWYVLASVRTARMTLIVVEIKEEQ
jgi:hypothetical protein